jgi:hypothetical protein
LANGKDPYYLINAHQDYDAPKGPYAAFHIANVSDIGMLEEGDFAPEGLRVKQHQNVSIIIDTFGEGARTAATRLSVFMGYPSMTENLDRVGVCYRDKTQVRDFTELIQAGYEERAQLEITLGTADGNLVACYNPKYEGHPSQPAFDPGVVPIEIVCVQTTVAPTGDSSDGTLDIGTVTVDINTQ